MAFNVQNFRSQGLKLGGARPSLFQVTIPTLPPGVGVSSTAGRLPFLVRAAQLPAATVDPVEVPYFGRKIKLAGDRTFADWTVTVMNDEDFALRSMFENWSNKINSHVGNVSTLRPGGGSRGSLPDGYKVDAIVSQFGRVAGSEGSEAPIIRQYKFIGIFPTTIDAIALDWDNTNTIETFDVTFSYDWWEPVNLTGMNETVNIDVGGGTNSSTPVPGGPG